MNIFYRKICLIYLYLKYIHIKIISLKIQNIKTFIISDLKLKAITELYPFQV